MSSSTTLETSFAAPLVSENTLLQFELLVTDDSNATATDVIDVTVTPPTYIVSGTITVPDGNVVDSDVNNLDAPYAPNDSPGTAQILPNPVTVGGYANRRNRGPSGRSQLIGDQQDFYRGVLTVGQTITLRIGDAASGDLDLYLWDLAGTTIVAASLGITEFETVVAPTDGEDVIEIFVFSGASNYVLNLETTGAPASASAGYNLDNDFMLTEAIVRYRDTLGMGNGNSLGPQLISALAVRKLAGEPTRPMLYALGPDLDAIEQIAGLEVGEMKKRAAALPTDVQREKWKTLIALKILGGDPSVLYAEPTYIRHAAAVPNDEFYDRQWHYPFINLPVAWDTTMGDPTVIVAVIDTGVLVSHPDLQSQLVAGYDFISSTSRSNDGDGIDPDPDDPGDGCGVPPSL
ncbi:MAG: hypothetical protein IIB77_13755 [Proteobacteria bacterium]|nr:hypothetical protein [Pseudomonadota bacterium]